MNYIAKRILEWAIRQFFQVTSAGSYALAFWTWTGWDGNATGLALIQQLIQVLISILLFVVNERPWIKKVTG